MIKKIILSARFTFMVRVRDMIEFGRVIRRYFHIRRFAFSLCWLKASYLLSNPYQCSRRYIRGRSDEDELLYGETPLTVLETIMSAAGVTANDHVFELGAGSGYTSLWLNCVVGCQVTAVEQIPVFCWRLKRTAERFHCGIKVRCENFLETDFSQATIIYLYGTALSEDTIIRLGLNLSKLNRGTKIVTINYSLADFFSDDTFVVKTCITVTVDWGEVAVFVQEVRR